MMIGKISRLIWSPSSASSSTGGTSCTLAVLIARSITIELVAVSVDRVELLQLLHRLDAERRRRVAEPEDVGGEVERDQPERGVVGRDLGEERAQDRPDQLDQRVDDPGVLGDLEQPEEEGEHADQAERDLGGGLGEVERRGGDGVELDEADRLEDRRGGRAAGRGSRQAALQLVVARAGRPGDRGERLGKLGAGREAELRPSCVWSR